jgi:integrase
LRDTGEGSVYGRADSRFLWVTYRHGGKTINKSTKTADPRKARKVLRELLVKRDAGDRAPESRMVTVGELRDMFMADLAANERRAPDRAERAAAHVVAYFGEATLARAIAASDVSAFVAKRREDAENSSVNRELAALRRMLRLGVLSGKLERRPEVPMLADSAARKGFLERAQVEAVIGHLAPDFRAAVVVAYATGWRTQSEVLTRRWQHVDLKAGWLRLDPGETKNGQGRMFPLTPELSKLLTAVRKATTTLQRETGREIAYVFHRAGRPLLYRQLLRAWRRACKDAGVAGRLLHDMRRSAVRNLERAGVPRSTAMAMVGHETEAIYRRYAIVDEVMLREGAKKLAALKAKG